MVAKWLDKFLLDKNLVGKLSLFRVWIGTDGVFHDQLVLLELKGGKSSIPFKFNPLWLKEEIYVKMVKDVWSPFNQNSGILITQ